MNQARRGLTTEEAALLRETKGANVYEKLKRKSFWRRLLENFKDPIIRILLIAMGVNLLFTIKNINWAENAGIILAVLISTFVSAISEQGSERAFERLKEEQKKVNAQVLRDGKPVIFGKVGVELTQEEGYQAARLTGLNLIAQLKKELGDLDRVKQFVKVQAFVASAPDFTAQPAVMNGVSDLFAEVFGEKGKHARTAVAVPQLPFNIPIEVEMIVEVE